VIGWVKGAAYRLNRALERAERICVMESGKDYLKNKASILIPALNALSESPPQSIPLPRRYHAWDSELLIMISRINDELMRLGCGYGGTSACVFPLTHRGVSLPRSNTTRPLSPAWVRMTHVLGARGLVALRGVNLTTQLRMGNNSELPPGTC